MKILCIINSLRFGDTIKQLVRLSVRFKEIGYELDSISQLFTCYGEGLRKTHIMLLKLN